VAAQRALRLGARHLPGSVRRRLHPQLGCRKPQRIDYTNTILFAVQNSSSRSQFGATMCTYLGLDIGSNSLGSALIDTRTRKIIIGLSVFPAGVDECGAVV
jgi:hypothetical protein